MSNDVITADMIRRASELLLGAGAPQPYVAWLPPTQMTIDFLERDMIIPVHVAQALSAKLKTSRFKGIMVDLENHTASLMQ